LPLRYVIKARARREVTRAAAWWADNRTAAPGAVRIDFTTALSILVLQPGIGQKVATDQRIPVRRYLMSKTQRWIYYRVKGGVRSCPSAWCKSTAQKS
jgi:plasmid stabilization system protein ParE